MGSRTGLLVCVRHLAGSQRHPEGDLINFVVGVDLITLKVANIIMGVAIKMGMAPCGVNMWSGKVSSTGLGLVYHLYVHKLSFIFKITLIKKYIYIYKAGLFKGTNYLAKFNLLPASIILRGIVSDKLLDPNIIQGYNKVGVDKLMILF